MLCSVARMRTAGPESITTESAPCEGPNRLIQGMADERGEFAEETLADTSGDRHFMLALEFLDRAACRIVQDAGLFDLAVAIFRQRALYRHDARRRSADQIGDRIIAARGDRLRGDSADGAQ